jgi:hypothetical protein
LFDRVLPVIVNLLKFEMLPREIAQLFDSRPLVVVTAPVLKLPPPLSLTGIALLFLPCRMVMKEIVDYIRNHLNEEQNERRCFFVSQDNRRSHKFHTLIL